MAWLPWATLPARSSMTTQELVDWLRQHAIAYNAPPQFIDAIDGIIDADGRESEIGDLREGLEAAEDERSALADALNAVLEEINPDDVPPAVWEAAKTARDLLKRLGL